MTMHGGHIRPRARAVILALLLALCGVTSAAAQGAFPTGPITVVVPFPPGGSADQTARHLAVGMERALRQSVIIVNKTGAGGAIGLQFLASSKPDGHTIALTYSSFLALPEINRLQGRSSVITAEDFTLVAGITSDPLLLVVRGETAWKTARDVIDEARRRPDQLKFGSIGTYTSAHLGMEVFSRAAGLKLRHVPFAGAATVVEALLGGVIDIAALGQSTVAPYATSGKLRPLASFGDHRIPALSYVPTLKDVGLADAEFTLWTALLAPRGTPTTVVARFASAARAAVQEPEFRAAMERFQTPIVFREGDDLRRLAETDARRVVAILRGGTLPATASTTPSAPPAPPSSTPVAPPIAIAPPVTPAPAPARPAAAPMSPDQFGRYHAVVIGNEAYRNLTRLKTPGADARAIAALLQNDYGFQSVQLLVDATRAQMVRALDDARRRLGENDNLLIYYAGHGWLDREADRGYWLGVDAETDTRGNWLSNADITDTLRALKAKHVFIVADSCYSGSLVRDVGIQSLDAADLARLARKRARTVLTSGGLEPVLDVGGGGHSVFARAFLETLREAPGATDFSSVFGRLRRNVLLRAEQTPQYGDLRLSGHEGGDFIFVRKR